MKLFIPSVLKEKIDNCHKPIFQNHFKGKTTLCGNFEKKGVFYLEKVHTSSGPRYLWLKYKTDPEIELYVLRDFLYHEAYQAKYHGGDINEWGKDTPLSEDEVEEIESFIKDLKTHKEHDNEEILLEVNNSERPFLENPLNVTVENFEITIFETEKWIQERIQNEYNSNLYQGLKIAIDQIMADEVSEGWHSFPNPYDENESIAAYLMLDAKDAEIKDLILLGTLKTGEEPNKYFADSFTSPEDLRKNCRRAYPYTFLDNPDAWLEMEEDPDSNFILSEEERDVVITPQKYPFFISGRAGSGKSTVLQYLFAEVILRFLLNNGCDDEELLFPAYISYSQHLIDNAKKLTESLLTKNHLYKEDLDKIAKTLGESRDNLIDNTLEPMIQEDLFWVFTKLLRETIYNRDETILKRFSEEKRISYSKFEELWKNKFGKNPDFKKYSPELCWYIIRTYIKGWKSDSFLTPEEYLQIGSSNQDVDSKAYSFVFRKIWEKWYKNLRTVEGYWDDQDLVREALVDVAPRFSAIFCDEAQDFTRIELEFIIKLSIFSHKKLDGDEINKVPFVFAGDEFQTLNPTGFSWDSLRSSFFEILKGMTKVASFNMPDPVSLVNNYRSTPNVVKLGNRLQLLRETRCQQSSKPQKTYFTKRNNPIYALGNEEIVWNHLKQNDVVLILPVDEGQSLQDYVTSKPELKNRISFNEHGDADMMILNTSEAKGLEFPNVAIFGYGDTEALRPSNLLKWFENEVNTQFNLDEEINVKHHLNNAYVAVTRAKNNLYIIADNVHDMLWGIAMEDHPNYYALNKHMTEALSSKGKEYWKEENRGSVIGHIILGDYTEITNDNTKELSTILKDIEKRARNLNSSDLWRKGAQIYRSNENYEDAARCSANAFMCEYKFEEAAAEFIKAKMPKEAASALWRTMNKFSHWNNPQFLKVLDTLEELALKESTTETELAYRVKKANSFQDVFTVLDKILSYPEKENQRLLLSQYLLDENFRRINKVAKEEVERLANLINEKMEDGWKLNANIIISSLNQHELYEQAVKIGDKLPKKPKDFFVAKAKSTQYPERSRYYIQAFGEKGHQMIYNDFKEHGSMTNTDSEELKGIIYSSCLRVSKNLKEIPGITAYLLSHTKTISFDDIKDLLKGKRFNPKWEFINLAHSIQTGRIEEIEKALSNELPQKVHQTAQEILEVMKNGFGSGEAEIKVNVTNFFKKRYHALTENIMTTPLLLVLGQAMEKRLQHLDSVRFYEWAAANAHSNERKLFQMLRYQELKEKPNVTQDELDDSRREVGLGPIDDVNDFISKEKAKAWERIYNFILSRDLNQTLDHTSNKNQTTSHTSAITFDNLLDQKFVDEVEKNENTFNDEGSVKSSNNNFEESDGSIKVESSPSLKNISSFPDFHLKINDNYEIVHSFKRKKTTIYYISDGETLSLSINKGKVFTDGTLGINQNRLSLDDEVLQLSIIVGEYEAQIEWLTMTGEKTGIKFSFPI